MRSFPTKGSWFLVVLSLVIADAALASCPDFLAPSRFGTGNGPYAVVIADLNGDSAPDIAVANKDSGSVSVLVGNANGYFSDDVTYSTGSGPRGIAAADFNGDHYTDLAVANSTGDSVAVLLNNTFGGFAAPATYATDSPYAIVAADFTGDGKPDLAVANYDIHKVSILVNSGSGAFAAAVPYSVSTNPTALYAINVEQSGGGDSDLDLIVANAGLNTVSVIKNNGSGVFGAPDHYTVGSSPTGVTAGDFNGDGRADIAASVWTGNNGNVAILLANQNGGYDTAVNYATGLDPVGVAASDLDGDGHLDLATVNKNDDSVSVLIGNTDGTFDPAASYGTGQDPASIAIGNLNGDGHRDVVVTNSTFSEVSVLFGAGNGVLVSEYVAGEFPSSTAAGDFDEDGNKDLAVAAGAQGLAILRGKGNDNFAPAVLYAIPSLIALRLDLGDVNNDGITDIVVVTNGSSPIRVFLGNGSGGVGNGTFTAGNNYAAGNSPSNVAIGYLDGDANLDLAVANQFGANFSVLTGNGDGTFDAAVNTTTGSFPVAVSIANLDGDSDNDLVLVTSDQVSVHLGNGDGTFGSATNYATGSNPRELVVANFDGDGDLDVATANAGSDNVSILKNNGNGTFAAKVDYDAGSEPRGITAADFDGDGKIDLAVPNNWGSPYLNFAILTGNGNATFDSPFYGGWAYGGWWISAADFDNNGSIDLAVTLGQTVAVALNRSTCATTSSATPNSGPTSGGTSVTIAGTNLSGAVSVTFGGSNATITGNTATSVTVTTPPHAAAPVDVVVSSAGGITTLLGGFTYSDLPATPTGLVATMATLSSIGLNWNAVSGATSYEIDRKAAGGSFVPIDTAATNSYTDSTASAGNAYLYRVRAVNGSGASGNSNSDLATVVAFSDVPLVVGTTTAKATHLAQLRSAVDAVRALAGLGAGTYTDPASAGTTIKAVHWTELRTQLDAARSLLGLTTGGYTDASLTGIAVKAVHVQDLRDRVQ